MLSQSNIKFLLHALAQPSTPSYIAKCAFAPITEHCIKIDNAFSDKEINSFHQLYHYGTQFTARVKEKETIHVRFPNNSNQENGYIPCRLINANPNSQFDCNFTRVGGDSEYNSNLRLKTPSLQSIDSNGYINVGKNSKKENIDCIQDCNDEKESFVEISRMNKNDCQITREIVPLCDVDPNDIETKMRCMQQRRYFGRKALTNDLSQNGFESIVHENEENEENDGYINYVTSNINDENMKQGHKVTYLTPLFQFNNHVINNNINDNDDDSEKAIIESMAMRLYRKMIDYCQLIDSKQNWNLLNENCYQMKDVEYIEYCQNGDNLGWHYDIASLVTIVVMLSDSTEYQGANFQTLSLDNDIIDIPLQLGDALVFNSEKCLHRVDNLVSGKRTSLCMELLFWAS